MCSNPVRSTTGAGRKKGSRGKGKDQKTEGGRRFLDDWKIIPGFRAVPGHNLGINYR
jgi:hypothetical protein